ncbi:Flp family type IVb pilin [Leekyejoonella antrihumi]|uniref:Flp family type IVb pilin n=2 Tax=Leekyejoonella antrihumi TaxID=1660198 RepID=A0A563DU26_9MICO|nr:Flp family type IVb pilin [Leekyejoonella antrihumi]
MVQALDGHRESGVTAIEYGLLAVFIALAMVVGATLLGTKLSDLFTAISGDL